MKDKAFKKYLLDSLIIFVLGLLFGLFSRILDYISLMFVSSFLVKINLGAFFSRLSIWLLLALIISIVSSSSYRAMINVPVFFIGLLLSYYICIYIIEGKIDMQVIGFWLILTAISPLLSYFCWYTKEEGVFSIVITSIIWSILFVLSVNLEHGVLYLKYNGLEFLNFIASVILLRNHRNQMIFSFLLFIILVFFLLFVVNINIFLDKLYFV